MRASEIAQRPVVTMAGEDVAQIKDLVYSAGGGEVVGFTLAGRGMFAGPLHEALPWSGVSALGANAVMITSERALEPLERVLSASVTSGGSGEDILGSRVLTDEGTDLGAVVDVIVEVGRGGAGQGDVVGYEISPSEAMGSEGTRVLIPLPDTMAASGEHLIVPANVKDFVRHDLAGFGSAVDGFRAQWEGRA